MGKIIMLIFMIGYGAGTGVAIEQVPFDSEEACTKAQEVITENTQAYNSSVRDRIVVVCVNPYYYELD